MLILEWASQSSWAVENFTE